MKELNTDFECNDCLSDRAYFDQFHGTTFAYAMNTTQRENMLCHYILTPVIAASAKEAPQDTRGYREMLRKRGKKVPLVKEDALRDELFVVPGAAMTPADIVKALREFIHHIERHGMLIGKYGNSYIKESLSGELEER